MTEAEWLASEDPPAMLAALPTLVRCDGEQTGSGASSRKLRLFACAVVRAFAARLSPEQLAVLECAEAMADGEAGDEALYAAHASEHAGNTPPRDIHLAVLLARCAPNGSWGGDFVSAQVAQYVLYMEGTIGPRAAALLREIVGNPFRPVKLPTVPPPKRPRKCANCRGAGASYCHWCKSTGEVMAACGTCRDRKQIWTGRDGMKWIPCAACPASVCPWLTPDVATLARAAYEARDRPCLACNRWTDCAFCKNTRRLPRADGTLDPQRLAVLSDALEEAGCRSATTPARIYVVWKSNHEWLVHHSSPDRPDRDALFAAGTGEGAAEWAEANCGVETWQSATFLKHIVMCEGVGKLPDEPHPLLAHLRGPGPHVRGCWALDLILGKE